MSDLGTDQHLLSSLFASLLVLFLFLPPPSLLVYDVSAFSGEKWVVISTSSWLGGKNDFLGWAYVAVGGLSFLLALFFLIKELISPRYGHERMMKRAKKRNQMATLVLFNNCLVYRSSILPPILFCCFLGFSFLPFPLTLKLDHWAI